MEYVENSTILFPASVKVYIGDGLYTSMYDNLLLSINTIPELLTAPLKCMLQCELPTIEGMRTVQL